MVYSTLSAVSCQGPENCIETKTITDSTAALFVPPGTVCFQCDFGGGVADDSTFQINSAPVDSSQGTTVMGVLVISSTEEVFSGSFLSLRCTSGSNSLAALVSLRSKFISVVFFFK